MSDYNQDSLYRGGVMWHDDNGAMQYHYTKAYDTPGKAKSAATYWVNQIGGKTVRDNLVEKFVEVTKGWMRYYQ